MASFQKGQKQELLNLVGVVYGYILIEGCHNFFVYTVEQGSVALKGAVERELLTSDEAQTLCEQMSSAGIPQNWMAFFEAVSEVDPSCIY